MQQENFGRIYNPKTEPPNLSQQLSPGPDAEPPGWAQSLQAVSRCGCTRGSRARLRQEVVVEAEQLPRRADADPRVGRDLRQ